jgi:hypothetical protein
VKNQLMQAILIQTFFSFLPLINSRFGLKIEHIRSFIRVSRIFYLNLSPMSGLI